MQKRGYFLATVLAGSLAATLSYAQAGEGRPTEGLTEPQAIVRPAIQSDVSPALRSIPPLRPTSEGLREMFRHHLPIPKSGRTATSPQILGVDPALQTAPPSANLPDPIQSFDGIGNVNNVLPPDSNGDVGPNHYVQWVNLSFAIWNKTGTLLFGPAAGNTLWAGFGGPCETTNNGDPIVQYDHLADRWLMSQLALPNFPFGPFFQCIAISQTPDPTGTFFRYAFRISDTKLNDYPKFGVWPDAYYMSMNEFNAPSFSFAGQGAVAFERDKMLVGDPDARMVLFEVASPFGGMLPSDLDGPAPPAGSPNFFIEVDFPPDFPTHRLNLFQFHVDWTDPSASTFTGPTVLETDVFNANLCNFSRNCIPQPDTFAGLDAFSALLMYRLQYRNFGDHESLVANHTVNVAPVPGANQAGIRWYEVQKSADSDWAIFQQGTYAPDDDNRWMGSMAMDGASNIALGFSVSSRTTFPSIRYVGRVASDPPGTLPQGEAELIAGSGSQTHSASRWGDYSMMAVDSTDDCTFWYTQEYYATTSVAGWRTRIGSFQFPGCGQPLEPLLPRR